MTAMLRRLTLQRFRSLRSANVQFDNPTFFVGQNGAGKSNIVDALSLLADAMASPLSAVFDKRFQCCCDAWWVQRAHGTRSASARRFGAIAANW